MFGFNVGLETRLGPLHLQEPTFLASSLTSGYDPKEKWAVPEEAEHWSPTSLREKLIKIGAKVVRHGRYITFQLAEVAVPRNLFRKIPRRGSMNCDDRLQYQPEGRCGTRDD